MWFAPIEKFDENLAAFVDGFLQLMKLNMGWDGSRRAAATMTKGTPQGSPLPPVLLLTGVQAVIDASDREAEQAIKDHQNHLEEGARREGFTLDVKKREVLIFGLKEPTYGLAGLQLHWELKLDTHSRKDNIVKAIWAVASGLSRLSFTKWRQIYTGTTIPIACWVEWAWMEPGAQPETKLSALVKGESRGRAVAGGRAEAVHLGEGLTVNDAELIAIAQALETEEEEELLIISDSLVAIGKMQKIAEGRPTPDGRAGRAGRPRGIPPMLG
ncbi:hypothetical protein BDZ91DRAFT_798442 [Kalaharituber pfeilii]|nr:hypothetical protein BDZ91DRAFT_798442 [Kalaharituber pfeilii]